MEPKIYTLSISLIRFLSFFLFFYFVAWFLCRAVNTSYRVLVEHGPAYREWVWGAGPLEKRDNLLRILRAGTELLRYFEATPGSSAFLARLTEKVEECVEDWEFSTMQRELHLEEAAAEANRRAEEAERRNGELQARHQALERALREGREGRTPCVWRTAVSGGLSRPFAIRRRRLSSVCWTRPVCLPGFGAEPSAFDRS